jgi:hypothetical protein
MGGILRHQRVPQFENRGDDLRCDVARLDAASYIARAAGSRTAAAVSTLIPTRIRSPIAKPVSARPMMVGIATARPLTLVSPFTRILLRFARGRLA